MGSYNILICWLCDCELNGARIMFVSHRFMKMHALKYSLTFSPNPAFVTFLHSCITRIQRNVTKSIFLIFLHILNGCKINFVNSNDIHILFSDLRSPNNIKQHCLLQFSIIYHPLPWTEFHISILHDTVGRSLLNGRGQEVI